MLDRVSVIDETWARAYQLKLQRQSSEWRHTYRNNARFDKISSMKLMINLAYGMQGIFVCLPVPVGQDLRAHSMTSCFRSTAYVVQVGRSPQNCLKIPSSYMIILQPTLQTLEDVL
jgi:hypothetical protein